MRIVRPAKRADELTGNSIYDGCDDDPVSYGTLLTLGVVFVAVLIALVLR